MMGKREVIVCDECKKDIHIGIEIKGMVCSIHHNKTGSILTGHHFAMIPTQIDTKDITSVHYCTDCFPKLIKKWIEPLTLIKEM